MALQVAQPVSGHLVDREVFETPTIYNYERRDAAATAITSSTAVVPTASAKPGSGCKSDLDCASGSCDAGKCVPKIGTGVKNSFCTSDNQCTESQYCYRGSCQEIKQDGSNCYKDSGCASGHCVNKRCVAPVSLPKNASCTKSEQCKDGFFCNNSKCDNKQRNGAYCYKAQGCFANQCNDNKCGPPALVRLGGVCGTDNNRCESKFCFNNLCRAKKNGGATCSLNDACLSGRCVSRTNCTGKGRGRRCTTTRTCA